MTYGIMFEQSIETLCSVAKAVMVVSAVAVHSMRKS
jgi:hypothetical protein